MQLEQLPPRFCIDMKKTKAEAKISKVMREYKAGTLHSGKGGAVVKNPKQAVAIALSSAGMSKPKTKKR
jgi:ribosomal protein L21E